MMCMRVTDYVKTARAIGEKIGLLPPGAPEHYAIDCAVIRVNSVCLVLLRLLASDRLVWCVATGH
jgi:hypothetical protein